MGKGNKKEKDQVQEVVAETPVENSTPAEETVTDPFELEVTGEELNDSNAGEFTAEELQEMELEMEIDGDELENYVKDNVEKKEKQKNDAEKSKPGPKGPRKNKEDGETAEKKQKEINLSKIDILEREIKKGTVMAPQARLEKIDSGENAGKYRMLLSAKGLTKRADIKKEDFEEVGIIDKMVDGKTAITLLAADKFGTDDKFTHKAEDGKETQHDYVRVELHKPGRDKDVTEIYRVADKRKEAKSKADKSESKEEKTTEAKEKDENKISLVGEQA